MTRLQAVFWDVDGTLADTEMDGHRPAFNAAFEQFDLGWHWDPELYQQLLAIPGGGQRMVHYAKQCQQPLDSTLLEALKQAKKNHYLSRIRSGAVALRPGVTRLLDELQNAGVTQWIVTSSGRASVEALLEGVFATTGSPFAGFVSSDDVAHHKPAPDPYLCALQRSGVAAASAIAIEDSAAGLIAASEASLACLVTPSGWDQQLSSQWHRAAAVVNHLGEPGNELTQLAGPPCSSDRITLEYLESLLECDS